MRTLYLLAVCMLIPVAACHHARSAQPGISSGSDVRPSVHVENKHWLDVVVYVEHDGQRSRLGTVTAASTASFTLSPTMVGEIGEIQLIADPVGSAATATTGKLIVKPGTRVDWTIETDPSRSTVSVY